MMKGPPAALRPVKSRFFSSSSLRGAQITALTQNERYKWCHIRTPLGDTPTLMGAVKALAMTVVSLLLLMFLGELIFAPDKRAAMTYEVAGGMRRLVVNFADFAVRTTVGTMRFQLRPKTVGGEIDLLVLRRSGAEWVRRKTLREPQ